jgi:hypothetical protein
MGEGAVMLNLQEMKDQSHAYIEGGYLYTPIYSPHDILALIKRLESAEEALEFYADAQQSWKTNDDTYNVIHPSDISEEIWVDVWGKSKFNAGGKTAREHFKKYPCKK